MLVLTRRVGDAIAIDVNIRVSVLAIQGRKVHLGFNAPASVPVTRTELGERNGTRRARSKNNDKGGER
jgi:carbon storage regulator